MAALSLIEDFPCEDGMSLDQLELKALKNGSYSLEGLVFREIASLLKAGLNFQVFRCGNKFVISRN